MADIYESGLNPVDADTGNKDIYFSNEDFAKKIREGKKASNPDSAKSKKNKKGNPILSTYLFFVIVIAVSMCISVYAIFCLNDLFGITKTKATVTVNFSKQIDEPSEAIDLLADNGLIKCKNFCKLFVNLETMLIREASVKAPYEAGVYYLNGKMGLENMLVVMKGTADTSETVKITFPEGLTTTEIINKLVDNEVCDKSALLSVIDSTEFTYSLVSDLKSKESVPYRLEGYLFPETYYFYVGQSASSAIETLIKTTEDRITEKHRKQAKKLGFSMNEIITIASIIQAEAANKEQMKEIAAVIENRLKDPVNYPSLGCQSTSDYIKNKLKKDLSSSTSAHTQDYYLKYYSTNSDSTVVGLPEGPICNPGLDAIEAALYPADSNDYYFFHDKNRKLYTAETYSEFRSKIQTYAPYLSY
ncbi:MAG: endolytic transglycosylase MltG [Eubacterium sp.]|nr:endolytic transglycosylase MltG [Eubacterium sp.]